MADPVSITIAAGSLVVSTVALWRQHRATNRPDVGIALQQSIAEPRMAEWEVMRVRPWSHAVRIANREATPLQLTLTLVEPSVDKGGSMKDIGFILSEVPGRPIAKTCVRRLAANSVGLVGFKAGVTHVIDPPAVPTGCSRPGEPEPDPTPSRGVEHRVETPEEFVMRVEIRRWSWSPTWKSTLILTPELPPQRALEPAQD